MPLGRKAGQMLKALDRFLVEGLAAVEEPTARKLGAFLRANGFGTAAERARLMVDDAPEKRYRAYVELRISLEEALVKLFRPTHHPLPADLAAGHHSRHSAAVETSDDLLVAARDLGRTAVARTYLAREPDLSGLDDEQVATLMANDDLRRPAARLLRRADPGRVREWVRALVGRQNGLARRGAYLLATALEPEEAAIETLPSWSRPEDHDEAFEALYPLRSEARTGLVRALDPDAPAPLEARRFALRLVARSGRPGECERWTPLAEEDPELRALVRVAGFKADEVDVAELRSWASSLEEPELRAAASAQLYLEGELDSPRFLKELARSRDQLPRILAPLRGTSKVEGLVKRWLPALDFHTPRAERMQALREVIACGDRRLVPTLMASLRDPVEEVRNAAIDYLTGVRGLLACRLCVDFCPLDESGFDSFSTDIVHGYERHLLPYLPRCPDLRLVPYLGYLLRRRGEKAVPPATLTAMGEALIPLLGTLLDRPETALSLLALRQLEELRGDPRVDELLERRAFDQDPLELAVDRLQVEALREEAAATLDAMDRESTVPRLLELARARKEARDPILALLTAWRAEEAVPMLAKLLGSPLPDMVRGKPGARETRWLAKPATEHLLAFGECARVSLERALGKDNWTVRHHAAHLLGEVGAEASSPALAAAIEAEGETEVRVALVRALGRTGGGAAVEPLARLAREGGRSLQPRAIQALALTGHGEARQVLEEILSSCTDLSLKRELRKALGAFGDGRDT